MRTPKKIVVVLDDAHGEDVAGKRSPDGRHLEWKWSRERNKQIKIILEAMGFEVYLSNPTNKEIGLTTRRKFVENLKVKPGQIKLFISSHNNAKGMGDKWYDARGFEIWTKKGIDMADDFATLSFPVMKRWFPEMRMRVYDNKPGFMDKEGELSVLKAEGVYSMLFEYKFQDNKLDVEDLLNPVLNKRYEDAIADIVEVCEAFVNKLAA